MGLRVAQHLFGNLIKDQSSVRQHGYQTLSYTHGSLTKADVEIIEQRAQFRAVSDGQIKWQFYWLSEDRAVISCLSPIAEPDEFGRKGRYMAHSLILHSSDLENFDGGPFDLMRADLFYTTMEKALAAGNLQSGELPETPIDIESTESIWLDHALEVADEWDGEKLGQIVRVISQARSLTDKNKYVAMIGNSEQVLDAVSVVFALAMPGAMRFCSFDTAAAGCDWARDATFLLRGFADERDSRSPFVIDIARREVKSNELTNVQLSPYERWVESAIHAKSFRDLLGDQEYAQTLDAILKGASAEPIQLREMSDEFANEFAQANAELIKERIKSFLPSAVSQALSDAVLSRIGSSVVERLRWLMSNIHGDRINDVVYQMLLLDQPQSPVASDLQAIKPLANDHSGIGLLLASWLDDEQMRRENLVGMKPSEYSTRVKELQSRTDFSAWHVFLPTQLKDWFDLCRSSIEMDDITKGLSSVADYGNSWERKRTTGIVEELKPEAQQKLWQWLQSSRRDLPELQAELEYALGIQSKKKTSRNWFNPRSWFKSSRGHARGAHREPINKNRVWKPILIVLAVLSGVAIGLWLFRQQQSEPVQAPITTKTTKEKERDPETALNKEADMFDQPNGIRIKVLLPGTKIATIDTPKTSNATRWVKIRIIEEQENLLPEPIDKQNKNIKDKKASKQQEREGWIKEKVLKP